MESEMLAAVPLRLPERKREILFLRFYLRSSDAEIGNMFRLYRTTVIRRINDTLRLLKKAMEVLENER